MKGINLGSGREWRYPDWVGYDTKNGSKMNEKTVLKFDDNTLHYGYSRHFFEHIPDAVAKNLITEMHRTLRPGGILRIVVPDSKKLHEKYLAQDGYWFTDTVGFKGSRGWSDRSMKPTVENLYLHYVCGFDILRTNAKGKVKVCYRGPPVIDPHKVRAAAESMSVGDFCDWAIARVPPKNSRIRTQHVNWWTLEKFKDFMPGFDVSLSEYGKSKIPEANVTKEDNYFDYWKGVDAREASLCIEGVKR
jgi:SAM-dependent methyltransferase